MKREETTSEKILNYVIPAIPKDLGILNLLPLNPVTGEITGDIVTMMEKDYYKKVANPKKPADPYLKVTLRNERINEKYYSNFTTTEMGYIFKMLITMDALGRLKYGDNFQQYCRTFDDLPKLLGVSYNTLKQSLIPKMKKYNVMKAVSIPRGEAKTDSFISFNPALALNGTQWDRWSVITWLEVIEEFNIISKKKVKAILNGKKTFFTEIELQFKEDSVKENNISIAQSTMIRYTDNHIRYSTYNDESKVMVIGFEDEDFESKIEVFREACSQYDVSVRILESEEIDKEDM